VLSRDELEERRAAIAASPDLSALRHRLVQRAAPVLARMPTIPVVKSRLTADGGVCPDDGGRLIFDPWSPTVHRCARCGREFSGERHDWAWTHYQHLWLAERIAHLATLAVTTDEGVAGARANQLLQAYEGYGEYPNRDNVLGPSRLFFSTYLESIWITNYLAAATLLRERELLDETSAGIVSIVADEAANLIGEYDEGLSNRQTWNNAALASIAVWFEDGELATRVLEGPSGILAHLLHGFGEDGMWYEGDNYHLFALRGQLLAMSWARQAGVDLMADPELRERLAAALRAPTLTALPDGTFPARKDSRFGVSLAQPMYLELWEVGLARVQGTERSEELWSWLQTLYRARAPEAQTFDSYLHEAGEGAVPEHRNRADLSWWSLLEMLPSPPPVPASYSAGSVLVEAQGLAVLRSPGRYASLECGPLGGGHGHADRLNLLLHAGGEYWLPDPGTGSYVARDLFWYRSTLAHNAPRLDGVSQPAGDASCDNFDLVEDWAWARGSFHGFTRTLVSGPQYLVDIVELTSAEAHTLELPWHFSGKVEIPSAGPWAPTDLPDDFVTQPQAVRVSPETPIVLRACGETGASLRSEMVFEGELIRAMAPGPPGSSDLVPFYVARAAGTNPRIITVLEPTAETATVTGVTVTDEGIEVDTRAGVERHAATVEGWEVQTHAGVVRLAGSRRQPKPFEPLIRHDRPALLRAFALPVAQPPALDGSLEGFETQQPIQLDHEDQYRRSEDPYPGPDEFSATAMLNWNDDALFLAVEVIKPEVFPRDPNTPPLLLDNEPDEIHADGIQAYLEIDGKIHGYLIVPSSQERQLIARRVSGGTLGGAEVQGSWERTEAGFRMTVALAPPGWGPFRPGDELGFDLIVNEMLPDRQRRAGQLVWSGGGGWVWLRGDRQDRASFGRLVLR
jgi:hypothetical protein